MKRSASITALFLDVGGVLLTDGWDHHARKRAAKHFKLDRAELEARHSLNFDIFEAGKLTLEEYLNRVVFHQKRAFTQAQFRRFMFAQSKACPRMMALVRKLKAKYALKIAVVSNEARELNDYRIRKFKLGRLCGLFYLLLLCPRLQAGRGHVPAGAGHLPGPSPADSLYRQHGDVRPDRGRHGHSERSACGLQDHLRKTGRAGIAE
jgi:hypothetical protein